MVKHWNTGSATSAVPTAQGTEGKSTKKRRLSLEPDANGDAVSDGSAITGARTPKATSEKTNGATEAQPAPKKAQKPTKYGAEFVSPDSVFLGGVDSTLDELDRDIFTRIQQPDDYPRFGDQPIGFLISGPPGTGKQSLIRTLAASTSTPIVPLGRYLKETRSPEKVSKIISDSLDEAKRCAPCVVLIERLHEFIGNKSGTGHNDFEQEVISQLELGMKRLREWEQEENKPVVVVATTSKLELVDPTLRRPDLFAQTINVKVPDTDGREEIFKVLSRDIDLPADFDFKTLAVRTHGFVGDDIRSVVQMANRRARHRLIDMERARAHRALQSAEENSLPAIEEPPWARATANLRVWYDYISHHSYTTPPTVHLTEQDFTAAIGEIGRASCRERVL